MSRRYDSFVLRRWQCDGDRRMNVEHLQSGGCLHNATLTAAVGWIGERCGDRDNQGVVRERVGPTGTMAPSVSGRDGCGDPKGVRTATTQ